MKVKFNVKIHGEFEQTPSIHLRKHTLISEKNTPTPKFGIMNNVLIGGNLDF